MPLLQEMPHAHSSVPSHSSNSNSIGSELVSHNSLSNRQKRASIFESERKPARTYLANQNRNLSLSVPRPEYLCSHRAYPSHHQSLDDSAVDL